MIAKIFGFILGTLTCGVAAGIGAAAGATLWEVFIKDKVRVLLCKIIKSLKKMKP